MIFTPTFFIPTSTGGGGGGAYVGPGDVVSFDAWVGVRAYTDAGIGGNAIRLRESGGNTEQDFATVAGGGLDTAAITTFKGANNLFVVTLYDQTGNGHDFSQSTSGLQPAFSISGGPSGLPTIVYTSASQQTLQTPILEIPCVNGSTSVSYVLNNTGGSRYDWLNVQNGIGIIFGVSVADTVCWYAGNTSADVACTDGDYHSVQGTLDGAASTLVIDGSSTGGLSPGAATNASAQWDIGRNNFAYITGNFQELGIANSLLTGGNFTALNSNQSSYWGY